MKTGAQFFDELDGIPCHHGQVNGWHCFQCAIDFFDRVIIPAATANGYRAGIEAAAKHCETAADGIAPGSARGGFAYCLAAEIRALAPTATTEKP